ncbi:hypothetical protein M422DRAFT_159487 [Sphaerobolus stellatus SS14]|nr:hypothetical protein M422DRAFT_159487 [Sphaerobolus stellatus SS14]
MNINPNPPVRVIIIAIGYVPTDKTESSILYLNWLLIFSDITRGATCSGKTTLAKHLKTCLYDSIIIHQDVCCPLLLSPQELIPLHPEYRVQDWDDAVGAIEWPQLASFLEGIGYTGILPDTHKSHDHLNENKPIPVDSDILSHWRIESEKLVRDHLEKYGERIVWAIVDGFLMYWDERVISNLDLHVLMRVPVSVLKQRRHERHGYHTAEGSLWRDPPNYWEQIVYPAYVRAHQHLFEGGDVENGKLTGKVPGLILWEATEVDVKDIVDKTMETVLKFSRPTEPN